MTQQPPEIDIYCERVFAGLFDEPLNLISNAAFLIAAYTLLLLSRKHISPEHRAQSYDIFFLIAFVAIIGMGSALFHSYATLWSKFADVIPILIFQLGFIAIYASRIMKLSKIKILGLIAVFFALSIGSGFFPYDWLNGSLGYAPALIFVLGFGIYHFKSGKTEPRILLFAAAAFAVSLTFRSIDNAVCYSFPMGVHYMWHILNGLVLYLSVRAVIVNVKYKS